MMISKHEKHSLENLTWYLFGDPVGSWKKKSNIPGGTHFAVYHGSAGVYRSADLSSAHKEEQEILLFVICFFLQLMA